MELYTIMIANKKIKLFYIVLLFFARWLHVSERMIQSYAQKHISTAGMSHAAEMFNRSRTQSSRDFDINDTIIHEQAKSSMTKVENFLLKLSS